MSPVSYQYKHANIMNMDGSNFGRSLRSVRVVWATCDHVIWQGVHMHRLAWAYRYINAPRKHMCRHVPTDPSARTCSICSGSGLVKDSSVCQAWWPHTDTFSRGRWSSILVKICTIVEWFKWFRKHMCHHAPNNLNTGLYL